MRASFGTSLKSTGIMLVLLVLQSCASTNPTVQGRASRNEAGQSALDGMENSVLKDNNPDTPTRVKSPN